MQEMELGTFYWGVVREAFAVLEGTIEIVEER